MTVENEKLSISHVGNGVVTSFPYDFLVYLESHMNVTLDGSAVLEGWSITGLGEPSGGQIIFDVAPSGDLEFIRSVPFTQEMDYEAYDAFPAQSHEIALDLAAMRDLQMLEAIRKLTLAEGLGAVSESQILVDGQTTVVFGTIDPNVASIYLGGDDVDSGRLFEANDYDIANETTIELINSYPAGAIILAIQGESDTGVVVTSFKGRAGAVSPILGDYPASLVPYDNATTGMDAEETQAAIDEVHAISVGSRRMLEAQIGDFRTGDTQSPAGLGDANKIIVHFGAGGNTTGNEFTVGADGVVTCNLNSKQYRFSVVISFIRIGATGVSEMLARQMYAPDGVNFVQVGGTFAVRIDDGDTVWREEFNVNFSPAVGSKLKVEVARNNGGSDSGDVGIFQPSGDLSGWNPATSALLRIFTVTAEI